MGKLDGCEAIGDTDKWGGDPHSWPEDAAATRIWLTWAAGQCQPHVTRLPGLPLVRKKLEIGSQRAVSLFLNVGSQF